MQERQLKATKNSRQDKQGANTVLIYCTANVSYFIYIQYVVHVQDIYYLLRSDNRLSDERDIIYAVYLEY